MVAMIKMKWDGDGESLGGGGGVPELGQMGQVGLKPWKNQEDGILGEDPAAKLQGEQRWCVPSKATRFTDQLVPRKENLACKKLFKCLSTLRIKDMQVKIN